MGFGAKAKATTKSYTENGTDTKEIFFPQASGPNGARVTRDFRILPDTEDHEETEVVFTEWRSNNVMVNGTPSFRSIIVQDRDNPVDAAYWTEISRIKEENDDEKVQKELIKAYRNNRATEKTSRQFVINVMHMADPDNGTPESKVKVLKGSWEAHEEDDTSGKLKPRNKNGGGTLYAKMIAAMQEGATLPDPKSPRKRITENDPTKFDLTFVTYGEGQTGKKNEIRPGNVYELDSDLLALPRYDLVTWVENATFSNEAVQELLDGEDYYKVVEKYGIQLYPKLREGVAMDPVAVVADDSGDELFDD